MVYSRVGKKTSDRLIVVMNVTPNVRKDWEVYVYGKKNWKEIFNSNDSSYWGTGDVYNTEVTGTLVDKKTQCYRLTLQLPPLAAIVLK